MLQTQNVVKKGFQEFVDTQLSHAIIAEPEPVLSSAGSMPL